MKFDLNLQIATYGLVITLMGLIFLALDTNKYNLIVVPLTSIGTSILATGLTSWLITRHFSGIDVTAIVQAIRERSVFIRTDQSLEIFFSLDENGIVKVSAEHVFTLINQGRRRKRKSFEIYTDLGSWNKRGGFESVVEPSGNVLKDDMLQACLSTDNGKTYYTNCYDINPKSTATFRFNTFGNYRRIDRLIWTVQDLSTDFRLRLVNNTGIKNAFDVKVNHHREVDIIKRKTTMPKNKDRHEVILLDFNCEVLPYQGFEVMWDLDNVLPSTHQLNDSPQNDNIPPMPPH